MSRGGKREGAGRPAGSLNKATAEIREAAQEYTEKALETLVAIMEDKDAPHAARVAAARDILDRGHGKPRQTTDLTSSDGSWTPKTLAEMYGELPDA